MHHFRRSLRPRHAGRGGFTLIEVVIAAALLAFASTVAMSSFIFVARSSKAIRTQAFMARDSLHVQRALKEYATTAEKFVLESGNVLQISQKNGTQSRLSYITGSDGNNTIIWDPVYGSNADHEVMIDNVTPLNASTQVFAVENTSRAVRLRFRIGDRFGNHADGHTGVGYQSYVVDSLFARRNSAT